MACGIMVAKDVQGRSYSKLLRVIFDSGGYKYMCHRRVVTRSARIDENAGRALMNTLAGTYASLGSIRSIQMKGMRLPAFENNRTIDSHEFLILDSACNYDIILGGDFLKKMRMNLNYADLVVDWLSNIVPMQSMNMPSLVAAHIDSYLSQMEYEDKGADLTSCAETMLDAKYKSVDVDEVILENCSHLLPQQQAKLRRLMLEHATLFDGSLVKYLESPMHI